MGLRLLLSALVAAVSPAMSQATLSGCAAVAPSGIPVPFVLSAPLDGPVTTQPALCVISALNPDLSPAHVQFALSMVSPCSYPPLSVCGVPLPAPLVVSPSSGTTPATVFISLNPNVLSQIDPNCGSYVVVFTTVGQSPPSTATAPVQAGCLPPPPPAITSVLGSADYRATLSPGEMVSIFGQNLAPPRGAVAYGANGLYPTAVPGSITPFAGAPEPNTVITFNGVPAPLLYISPGQVNALIPYEVAGSSTADVVVTRYGQSNAPFTVQLATTSPAVFTSTQTGTGQGAILNVPTNNPNDLSAYAYNSVDNPVAQGQAIEFFATGAGVWNTPVSYDGPLAPVIDGEVALAVAAFTQQPVSLTIGGQPAQLYYVGTSPYQVWGLLQITAFVPSGIGSGPQPLVLKIGQNDNSAQSVTVAVQ